MTQPAQKLCPKCKIAKPLEEFARPRHWRCKPCTNQAFKQWRNSKAGYDSAASAKYKAKYPDKIKAITKAYTAANKRQLAEKNRIWYQSNREYAKAKAREWRAANPERVRATLSDLRVKRNRAKGTHTSEDIKRLCSRQDGRCLGCGADLSLGYHVDHIMPLSKGGTNWPDNLQLLCCTCNRRKGRKLPPEWAAMISMQTSSDGGRRTPANGR